MSTAKQLNACITMRADAMRVRSAWRAAAHANAARPNVQVLNAVIVNKVGRSKGLKLLLRP